MQAFGGALRCLGSLSATSISYADASMETSSWSGSSSSDLSAILTAAAGVDAYDCYTVDVKEDSPSHPFLVRTVTNILRGFVANVFVALHLYHLQ